MVNKVNPYNTNITKNSSIQNSSIDAQPIQKNEYNPYSAKNNIKIEEKINNKKNKKDKTKKQYVRAKTIDYFKSTKKTGIFMGIILAIVALHSFMNFPVSSLFSINSNIDAKLSIGWPMTFFEMSLSDVETMPLKIKEFILCMTLYFLISYILDIFFSLLFRKKKTTDDVYTEARKAYRHLINEGKSREETMSLFKKRGWTDEQLKIISDE